MALITLQDVSRIYETGGEFVRALDGVSLEIERGELVMLLGPSGSGKTTLLNVISALDSPTTGEYRFEGEAVPSGKVEAMTSFRRENVGYVFQFFNLLGDLTALENVMLVQEIAGNRNVEAARAALESVGLSGLDNRFPSEMSGGQQQRVAIARSLAKKPKLLLGDEPTGNLDSKTSAQVMTVLAEACRDHGVTAIVVTHDAALTKYASRVIRIDSGRLVSDEPVVSRAAKVVGAMMDKVGDLISGSDD
jgi:putative ABC transport system ATP-binding protein